MVAAGGGEATEGKIGVAAELAAAFVFERPGVRNTDLGVVCGEVGLEAFDVVVAVVAVVVVVVAVVGLVVERVVSAAAAAVSVVVVGMVGMSEVAGVVVAVVVAVAVVAVVSEEEVMVVVMVVECAIGMGLVMVTELGSSEWLREMREGMGKLSSNMSSAS